LEISFQELENRRKKEDDERIPRLASPAALVPAMLEGLTICKPTTERAA
jgi:hypothetical protein